MITENKVAPFLGAGHNPAARPSYKAQSNRDRESSIDSHHGLSDATSVTSIESDAPDAAKTYGHSKKDEAKSSERRKRELRHALANFWRIFTAILFSPLFFRHRNLLFLGIEVLVPAIVTFIILGAFTSGISWKQSHSQQQQASSRVLNFPEISMDDTIAHFRKINVDGDGQSLIFYTPVNNITSTIMQLAMEQLGLQEINRLYKHGQADSGVLGVNSELEMFERAMVHRRDNIEHGSPAAVVFKFDDSNKSSITGLPYKITFALSLFDEAIFKTGESYPFIEPAETEDWKTPYLTSGFLGLQYAIEQSIIRLILERQRDVEMAELAESLNPKGRSGTFDDIDDDLFEFLRGESLDDDDEFPGSSSGRGRSLGAKHEDHDTKDGRPQLHRRMIKSAYELPERSIKAVSMNVVGNEKYRSLLTFVITFSFVISYCFMSFLIVKQIALENATGIKDLLQMHGLPNYIHWVMLFLHAMVFRAITSVLVLLAITIDLGHGEIIKNSHKPLIFFLIYTHELTLTFMNFLFAIFIRNVNMCGVVAIATGVFSFYLPETFYQMNLISRGLDHILTTIFPNWCLRQAIRTIVDFETEEKGVQWSNIFDTDHTATNTLSIGGALLSLIIIGTIYFVLAAYIDMTSAAKLFPQTYKWYQFKEKAKQKREAIELHQKLVQDIQAGHADEFEKPIVYEEPPPNKRSFVHIRNISKSYGKHLVALDSINLNLMHEEITCILGPSGCGKSTLISIMAGLVQPSNGYVLLNGLDVQYDTAKAREFLGLCPQKLVALNLLTVREHVRLCYMLRGYSSSESEPHVATLLTKLRLWKVRSLRPNNLTKDEIRRLGMAMALADTPKIFLLDEPTRGMDTIGRKEIWDIIHTLKKHHTIVLTTNYMDEAEYLADRIVFLSNGRLICSGTLDYLRSQYNTGYYLTAVPFPQSPFLLDTERVIETVKRILETDSVSVIHHTRVSEVDNLVLGLPLTTKDKFADMCEELDNNSETLQIMRYSIKKVSLNDIFIRLCSSVAGEGFATDLYVRRDSGQEITSSLFREIPSIVQGHREDGENEEDENAAHKLTRRGYFNALLKKRWTVIKSGGYAFLFHFIIPLIFIWVVVFQAKLFVESRNVNPAMEVTPKNIKGRSLEFFYRIGKDDRAINYTSHVAKVLGRYGKQIGNNERILTKLYEALQSPDDDVGYVKDDHLVAFEFRRLDLGEDFDTLDFVGYFASGALHSSPLAMNLMTNVYLSVISQAEWKKGEKDGRQYTATVINDPMMETKTGKFENGCGATCILLALVMSISISFISHFCVLLPILERLTGMKHLQLMCGVPNLIYWLADYIVDALIMFSVSFVIVIIFVADLSQTFHSAGPLLALWIICILYLVWSSMMYCYFMSTIIPKAWNGYNVLAVLHICLGIIPMLWCTLAPPTDDAGYFWRNFFEVLIPPYTITAAFYNFFTNVGQRNICKGINPYLREICAKGHDEATHSEKTGHYVSDDQLYGEVKNYDVELTKCCARICSPTNSCFVAQQIYNLSTESWDSPGMYVDTFALLFQGFIYCGLLFLSDAKIFQRLTQKLVLKFLKQREKTEPDVPRRFRDVRHESLTVRSLLDEETFPDDVSMICLDLTKSTTSKMIIKDFCLEAKKAQCIAILGRGTTGKTTIVKMIAGQLIPTQGNCYIRGSSLIHNRKTYLSSIGYCPQKSCLYPEMTGAQMLELMGRLRGIPPNLLNTHVVKWLNIMGLIEVAHDKCMEYGDGIQQRLRSAMAFIGEPDIILLDEPTSTIDPASRQRIWAVLDHLNKKGHTVIFTTYNTEEAFALSDRTVVLAEACVQTIGTPEKLRSTYGRGHIVTFKVRHEVLSTMELMSVSEGKLIAFKQRVHDTFKHIDLLDEQDENIMFFLRDVRMSWADVFRRAYYLATVHRDIIEDYEVSEGDIDDIFIFLGNKFHEVGVPRKSQTPEFSPISKKEAELKDWKEAEKNLKLT